MTTAFPIPTPGQRILAVDPGTTESAIVEMLGRTVVSHDRAENGKLLEIIRRQSPGRPHVLAIEMVASYGMPVGAEVFETCVFIGRMLEAWKGEAIRVYRKDVKMFLCGRTAGVTDAVIRQRLIDLYGPGKAVAIGTVKNRGPLHGITGDEWQALALALTAVDQLKGGGR